MELKVKRVERVDGFKEAVFLSLKSNVNTWPSNLLIAPVTNFFFNFTQKSLIKNFVLKLSEPSIIIS